MSHPRRHALILHVTALLAVAMAFWALLDVMRRNLTLQRLTVLPECGGGPDATAATATTGSGEALLNAAFVSLFKAEEPLQPRRATASLTERYRLVGVMLNAADAWKSAAFIEQRANGSQRRYRQGDKLDDNATIQSIAADEVWVRGPNGLERLLRESGGGSDNGQRTGDTAATATSAGANRFGGKQISADVWHFKRQAIMDYYQELLDRPERLVKVFDSLAPVYNDERRIEGYRVQIEGEADFFKAVDLRPGDIVRRVNAIEMSNRYRAENLIRRFADNDLEVVIIELERDGEPVIQTYHTE